MKSCGGEHQVAEVFSVGILNDFFALIGFSNPPRQEPHPYFIPAIDG